MAAVSFEGGDRRTIDRLGRGVVGKVRVGRRSVGVGSRRCKTKSNFKVSITRTVVICNRNSYCQQKH